MENASSIRCLVTVGPTREFLDPVRFLSNPSTGKMGFALASAAAERGWTVDLVSGPVSLPEPAEDGIVLYPVVSAEEMFHQVDALFDACDILIMTAAVSDFRPVTVHSRKEKKAEASLTVEFERTADILAAMAERKVHHTLVGFAAETENVREYAWEKLQSKNLDWIAANRIGGGAGGFGAEINTVLLLGADGTSGEFGPESKPALARRLLERIAPSLRTMDSL